MTGKLAALALLGTVLTLGSTPAAAALPAPLDLRVFGGEETWHSSRDFTLEWSNPPTTGPAVATTRYRLRDPQGDPIDGDSLNPANDGIVVVVGAAPGIYSAEVWFEDAAGTPGPAATVGLRFDDTRPGAIDPETPPDWIGRTAFPLRIRLAHPRPPLPISGIRGYAATIDAEAGGAPCAAPDRCSLAETTLHGGIGEDELSIAALPEGDAYLHAVAVSGSGMRSAAAGQAELHVDLTDPVTRLAGAPPGWTNRPATLIASATDARSGMAPAGEGAAPFTAIRIDDGAPVLAPGSTARTTLIEEGVHRIAYYARDAAGNVDDGAIADNVAHHPPRTAFVRIDRTQPTIAFAGSQDPRDPELLRASIGDALAGPDPSRGGIGLRPAGSGEPFATLPALPAAPGELRAHWDSDSYPAGKYEFRATGFDTAGNVATTTRRADGSTMILSNPIKATTSLIGSFADRRLRRTVPYGRGVAFAGRLTTGIRSPLAGMPVRIVERFAPGARAPARISTVTTGADGAYSLRLAPGPSREVTATFAGDRRLSRSASAQLKLAVRGAVELRVSSATAEVGGAPLVFRGAVAPRGEIPPGGLPVQLQFRLAGTEWSEFRTVQADRRGRFRYAYRFSDDDSRGARFQFRAYVPAHENWPYEPSGSRPVLVRGY